MYLIKTVKGLTRYGNTVDIYLTNRSTLVIKCTTIPELSDHDSELIDTDTKAKRSSQQNRENSIMEQS